MRARGGFRESKYAVAWRHINLRRGTGCHHGQRYKLTVTITSACDLLIPRQTWFYLAYLTPELWRVSFVLSPTEPQRTVATHQVVNLQCVNTIQYLKLILQYLGQITLILWRVHLSTSLRVSTSSGYVSGISINNVSNLDLVSLNVLNLHKSFAVLSKQLLLVLPATSFKLKSHI